VESHSDNYGRARAAVPRPEKFHEVERRLQMAIAANRAPGSLGRYAPVIAALQAELAQVNGEAVQGYADYAAAAADSGVTGDPLTPPPRPGVQAVGFDIPLTPPPAAPTHGPTARIRGIGSTSQRSSTSPKGSSPHTAPCRSGPGCTTRSRARASPTSHRRRRRSIHWTSVTS
jgi:hypothetical protein